MAEKLIIGTRSSKLALWQSNHVKEILEKEFPGIAIELKEIKTKGDIILDSPLSKIGDKGLFTKEIEEAILNNEVDIAVHSLKDLPTTLPSRLKIGALLKRENPHDVLISSEGKKFDELRPGSKIGTSSLRRVAQLKSFRDDLEYLDIRGNVDTRIRKMEEGEYDAIVLAYAGVKRLGLTEKVSDVLNPTKIMPAAGQGIVAVEMRDDDKKIEAVISKLNNMDSVLPALAERTFLATLEGGCQIPIGAYVEVQDEGIVLHGMLSDIEGKKIIRDKLQITEFTPEGCQYAGERLAKKILKIGGKKILQKLRQK